MVPSSSARRAEQGSLQAEVKPLNQYKVISQNRRKIASRDLPARRVKNFIERIFWLLISSYSVNFLLKDSSSGLNLGQNDHGEPELNQHFNGVRVLLRKVFCYFGRFLKPSADARSLSARSLCSLALSLQRESDGNVNKC